MFCLAVSMIELFCHLIIGLFIMVPVIIIAVILTISLLKMYGTKVRQKQAAAEARDRKFRPDGQPYPDSARGMCDSCHNVFEKVYYLPSGPRLCEGCYRQIEPNSPAQEEHP